jgi:hypothetical protein
MDAVEDYARRWIKREVDQNPVLESLSDWVRTIRSLVQDLSLYLKTKKLLIASIPLLANGIWRNFLFLS